MHIALFVPDSFLYSQEIGHFLPMNPGIPKVELRSLGMAIEDMQVMFIRKTDPAVQLMGNLGHLFECVALHQAFAMETSFSHGMPAVSRNAVWCVIIRAASVRVDISEQ